VVFVRKIGLLETLHQLMPCLIYRLIKVCRTEQIPPSNATTDMARVTWCLAWGGGASTFMSDYENPCSLLVGQTTRQVE